MCSDQISNCLHEHILLCTGNTPHSELGIYFYGNITGSNTSESNKKRFLDMWHKALHTAKYRVQHMTVL